MGQSVSNQLGIGALGYGADPAYIQQQILQQREKGFQQIANPQQQLAARLGSMLGGGLTNLAQDRGFFEVNDPLLNKVTQIQGIYNQVASQIDPTANPEQFFTTLQKAYAEAGLGQQALMASQEAQKAKTSGMDVQIKEAQLYKASPELLAGKIEDALKAGNEPEAMRLANINQRLTEERDLEKRAKEADIGYKKALTTKTGQDMYEAIPIYDDFGKRVGTEIWNKSKNKVEHRTTATIDTPTADNKGAKEKSSADPASFDNRNKQASPAAPAAAPAASPAAAPAQVDMGKPNMAAYNQNTGVYSLQGDPIIQMISNYASQNKTLLETNPEFRQSINDAFVKRKQELQGMLGRGVRME